MPTGETWELSAHALDILLLALAPDRDAGARCYEQLRTALLRFFTERAGHAAESLTDATFDRVCRRGEQGVCIERLAPFVQGVARNVRREHLRADRRRDRLHRRAEGERDDPWVPVATERPRLDCLRVCLDALPEPDRALVESYYEGDRQGARACGRRAVLAARLGISQGNLRVRAFRARRRLEESIQGCLHGGGCAATGLDALAHER